MKKKKIMPKNITNNHNNSHIIKVKIKQQSIRNKSIKSQKAPINVTAKINYKFDNNNQKTIDISSLQENKNNIKEKYYWFAAYDKLIKSKKILKIFSFYNLASKNSIAFGNPNFYKDFEKIKEKKLEIKNYEIFFMKNMNAKPFIRRREGKIIYVKLYLLTLKQINMIFSYLNKIEFDNYFKEMDNIIEKDKFINILREENKNINYPYILCLGSFMNIGIYTFSNLINEKNIIRNIDLLDLNPNPRKIAKLIKILIMNFPEHSKEFLIDYIFTYFKGVSNINDINNKFLIEKKNEINHLLISHKKSLYKISSSGLGINSGLKIGQYPELSFSPYLSSFINNSNKMNSNNKNNIININNNLGSISYNASCFDFTSDYLISIGQNEENLSKILDSIRSLSNKNKYTISDNQLKHKIKQLNSDVIKNNSNISNFSVDKDSKLNHNNNNNNKIIVNKKIYITRNSKKRKKIFIKKDLIKNIDNYRIPSVPSLTSKNFSSKIPRPRNTYDSYIKKYTPNTPYSLNKKYLSYTHNFTDVKCLNNNNKENSNTISNFGDINFSKINGNKITNNKKYLNLKGEDIFKSTNVYGKKTSSSFMYILDKNGVRSSDLNNIRRNKGFRLSNYQLINNK